MKKINWGTGIFIFYTLFAASLFYQVYRSTQYDHSLVVENYYEEDINYQSRYDQIQNSRSLKAGLEIEFKKNEKIIALDFPKDKSNISGEILLYRANNKKLDQYIPIQLNAENKMIIPTDNILMGRWKMEVEWETDGKSYFDKRVLHIPSA
ncbi:MAG: FixH family protein [Bacteroidota bacterium]